MLFVKFTMLFDEVMQDVYTGFRVWNSSHQRCHRTWEKRHSMEELLLAPSKRFEAHRTVLERLQVGIAPDARFFKDSIGLRCHARRPGLTMHFLYLRTIDIPDASRESSPVNSCGGRRDFHVRQRFPKLSSLGLGHGHEQRRKS